jgi:predicted DsbA family dithiol-disulfide isomerase
LKKVFPIQDEWLSYQLRPQTPLDGIPFEQLFPGVDMEERYADLNRAAAPFGITFGQRTFLSNSRFALEASEFARDLDKYEAFHERVFRAYFTNSLDIGDMKVVLAVARAAGLDPLEVKRALDSGAYGARIDATMHEATRLGVTAVPTFIVNDTHKIVGALPLDQFRKRLARIQEE